MLRIILQTFKNSNHSLKSLIHVAEHMSLLLGRVEVIQPRVKSFSQNDVTWIRLADQLINDWLISNMTTNTYVRHDMMKNS